MSGENKTVSFTLYSKWAISIQGGEHLTPPNPETDISVIFGVKLCIVPPYGYNEYQSDLVQTQQVNDCCPIRPKQTADCTECPTGWGRRKSRIAERPEFN